jgi:Tfp pilus assembly protein PilO
VNAGPKLFIALSAASLLAGAFACNLQLGELKKAEQATAERQRELDIAGRVSQHLQVSSEKLQQVRLKLAHLEKSVSDYQYVPTLLKELDQFGEQTGIEILGIRPQISANAADTATTKQYDEMSIEVKARGTYPDVLRFIKGLDGFPKIVAVRTVNLTPKPDIDGPNSNSPKLDLMLELRVFVFPKVDAPASVAVGSMEVERNG